MDIKPGDIAIFKNGEEAVVEKIIESRPGYFGILFKKKVSGWIGEEAKNNCWIYTKKGIFNTALPNGNDIVKVIPC